MAQIKVTLTIEANLMRDVHAAVDAANTYLQTVGGRIVNGKLAPDGEWTPSRAAALYDWHVTYRKIPTSYNQAVTTTVRAATSDEAKEIVQKAATASIRIEDVQGVKVESAPSEDAPTPVCADCNGRGWIGNPGNPCIVCDGDGLDECADCGGSTAVGTPDPHECAPDNGRTDTEANEQLVAALAALPSYDGWVAAWEYPGYIALHRKGSRSVFATPDYHVRGKIAVEFVQDDKGHTVPGEDVDWPREGRTPESYMLAMKATLDKAAPIVEPSGDADDIFEAVMAAMQPAEEISGPPLAQYVALMERIAHEAQRRATRAREDLEPREWQVKFNRDHVGCTQYIWARSRDEADTLWRARMIKDGETDVASIVAKIEVRS